MNITIRYFAITREISGLNEEHLSLSSDANVAAAWAIISERYPRLAPLRDHLRFAVNLDFANLELVLNDGDTLALIPPVSGGSPRCWISSDPLDEVSVRQAVARDSAGAIVVFHGVVRDHTGDRAVSHLDYEIYPEMALAKLKEIAEELERNTQNCKIAIAHRFGRLKVGETSVIIAASSPHRRAAFEACATTIDRMKAEVPIWKKEVGHDGEVWVGMGS